jgi:hypothetical protein
VSDANETPKRPPRKAPTLSRTAVVAFRLALLLLAAGAVTAALVISARDTPGTQSGARYVCPMHPEVSSAVPGQCPICRMALELVDRGHGAGSSERGDMPGMADMTAVENIRKHKIIDFVRTRSLLFELRELRGAAWVDADRTISAVFYDDQIDALAADDQGTFTLTRAPQVTFTVRRTDAPPERWDRSTSRIHFRLDAGAGARAGATTNPLGPGQVGWVELARRPREVLAVPASAVLQSPEGPYVLVPGQGVGFEKRPIEIGETFLKQGFAVVLSGLHAHDRVVSKATFFVDSDRRLGAHTVETEWATP